MSKRRLTLLAVIGMGLLALLALPMGIFAAAMLLPPVPDVTLLALDDFDLRLSCNPYSGSQKVYCGFIVHGTSRFRVPPENGAAETWCNALAGDTFSQMTPRYTEGSLSFGLLPRVPPGWTHCHDTIELYTGFFAGVDFTLP